MEEPEIVEQDQDTANEYAGMTEEQLTELLNKAREEAGAGTEGEQPPPEPKAEKPPEQKEPETPPETKPEETEVRLSREEYDKLQRQIKEKESFIQRQSGEVGNLRRQRGELLGEVNRLREEMDANIDRPSDNMVRQERINQNLALMRELENREVAAVHRVEVHRHVPDFEKRIDGIAELLREDGEDEGLIRQFQANPYLVPPLALLHMAKRAEVRTRATAAEKRIADLEAEIAKLKESPQRVLHKIEEAAKNPPRHLTAAGAKDRASGPATLPVDLSSLSDAELQTLIDQRKKEEAA